MRIFMWTQNGNNGSSGMSAGGALGTCVSRMAKAGYTEGFNVTVRGLYANLRSRYYRPEQVQVVVTYRFDTQEDPHNNAIMYVLETSDGIKGVLIDAYGHHLDSSIGKFISEVEDIQRKVARHDGRNFC